MLSSNKTKSLLESIEKNEDPSAFADALGLLEKLITKYIWQDWNWYYKQS